MTDFKSLPRAKKHTRWCKVPGCRKMRYYDLNGSNGFALCEEHYLEYMRQASESSRRKQGIKPRRAAAKVCKICGEPRAVGVHLVLCERHWREYYVAARRRGSNPRKRSTKTDQAGDSPRRQRIETCKVCGAPRELGGARPLCAKHRREYQRDYMARQRRSKRKQSPRNEWKEFSMTMPKVKEVYILESRFREDWKEYLSSFNEDNWTHFRHAKTEWGYTIHDGCQAHLSLKSALWAARELRCAQTDVRVVNFLTDEVVEEYDGEPAPKIGSPEWQCQKDILSANTDLPVLKPKLSPEELETTWRENPGSVPLR